MPVRVIWLFLIIIINMKYTNIFKYKHSIKENKIGVYRLTCNKNGKNYIGSTINLGGKLTKYYSKKIMLSKISTRRSMKQDWKYQKTLCVTLFLRILLSVDLLVLALKLN
jgi:GIY-YIG catalytic domain-containing protein